mmetsp:Transcript_10533/g.30824  ORF Transcript_10533/g.30824 Transcript_10533/m.30824 type:complete len:1896 (+) Transcript_10533:938-6625(+)
MNRVRYYDDSLTPFAGAPQDAPLENVRRKIQTIDRVLKDGEPIRQEHAVQKERIESLMSENADLNTRIVSLQEKLLEAQEQQKQQQQQQQEQQRNKETLEMASKSKSENTHSAATCDEEDSKEVSYEEFVIENKLTMLDYAKKESGMNNSWRNSQFSGVNKCLSMVIEARSSEEKGLHNSDGSSHDDSSLDSSFSTLEAPPEEEPEDETPTPSRPPTFVAAASTNTIDPVEYEELKQNFDKALDVIEHLKSDSKQRRRNIRRPSMHSRNNSASNKHEVEKARRETSRAQLELNKAKVQYEALQTEFKALKDRQEEVLAASKAERAELEASYKEQIASVKESSKVAFDDVSNMNNILRQQYDDLEKEYTLKIEALQKKLKEERNSGKERKDDSGDQMKLLEERIKKARVECDAMESIHHDRINELAKDHVKALEEVQEKYDDLKYEYDTFLEIHLKVEEDALEAKMHYKESLQKIRVIEAEARDSKESAQKTEAEHRQAMEKITERHNEDLEKIEAAVVEWRGKFHALKEEYVAAIKEHEETKEKLILDLDESKADHQGIIGKLGKMRQSDAAKYQKLRREFDAALVDHGKKEQSMIHKYEQVRKAYEPKIASYQKKIDEFERLLAVSKLDSQQQSKRKVDQIQSRAKEKTDELQIKLAETTKRLEIETETNRKLVQEQRVSKEERDRLEISNKELREVVTRIDEELRETTNQLKTKLEDTSGRLEFEVELNQRLKQGEIHSGERIDELVESMKKLEDRTASQDKELKESRDIQEELAASYQASLLKIESLLQLRENASILKQAENSAGNIGEDSVLGKGGVVLERIKQLEKKSDTKASKTKDQEQSRSPSIVDMSFQRDFDIILRKLGYDDNEEFNSDVSLVSSTTESFMAREETKAICDKIYGRVEELVNKMNHGGITQETEGIVTDHVQEMNKKEIDQNKEGSQQRDEIKEETFTDTQDFFGIAEIFDVLHHFVQLRKVNACFLELPRFQTVLEENQIEEKLLSDTSIWNEKIVSDLLIHKKRFKRVQNSLLRQTIVSGLDELYPSRLHEVYSSCCSFSRYSITASDLGFSTANTVSVVQADEKLESPSNFGFSTADAKSVMRTDDRSILAYDLGISMADTLSIMEGDENFVSPCDLSRSIADKVSVIRDGKTVTSSELGFSTINSRSEEGVEKSAPPSALPLPAVGNRSVVEKDAQSVVHSGASVRGNKLNGSVQQARLEAARLRDENFTNQVNISTEEIKAKTREKEVRLLDLKYKTLKEEFRQLQANEISSPPTDIAFPSDDDHRDNQSCEPSIAMSSVTHPTIPGLNRVDSLQKQVLAAELKVECSKRDLQGQKSWVNKARKEQQKIDHNLTSVLGHLQELKEIDESNFDHPMADDGTILSSRFDKDITEGRGLIWDIMTTSVKEEEESNVVDHDTIRGTICETKVSFDVSQLSHTVSDDTADTTTVDYSNTASTVSSEHRDDKAMNRSLNSTVTEETEPHSDQATGPHHDRSRSNRSTESIKDVRLELQQVREAAEAARRKQLEREEALRDVIFQYKELEKEHQALAEQKQQQQQQLPTKTEGEADDVIDASSVVAELKQAQANVDAMKDELEKACERHYQEKDNLMHVMNQYKSLQNDFYKILTEKQELEKVVYHRPGMPTTAIVTSESASTVSSVGATVGGESAAVAPTKAPMKKTPPAKQRISKPGNNNRTPVRSGGLLGRMGSKPGPKRVGPPKSPPRQPVPQNASHLRPRPGRPGNTNSNLPGPPKRTGAPLKPAMKNEVKYNATGMTGEKEPMQQKQPQKQPQKHPSKLVQPQKRRVPASTEVPATEPAPRSSTTSMTSSTNKTPTQMQTRTQTQTQTETQLSPTMPTVPTTKKKLGLFRGFGFYGGSSSNKSKKGKAAVRS